MKLQEFKNLIREEVRKVLNQQTTKKTVKEGKMVIHPAMDKSVKTPWGKGGPRSIVVLGKTTSGLDVTLNGDFVDAKAGKYVTNPTGEDKKEAKEMVQFHYDRLTGGLNKEKLAAVLHMFESFLNENLNEANKFTKFSDLEQAIKHHEKGNPYYDETKLISLFNQLSSSDQIKARNKYKKYFIKSTNR